MTVSSTLVNVAEDAELRLVAMLASSSSESKSGGAGQEFQDACNQYIQAGDAATLLQTIVQSGPAMQALVSASPPDEGVAAVSLLAALLQKTNSDGVALADAILAAKTVNDGDDTDILERKISLLAVLYNMVPPRCALLTRMIAAAGKAPNEALLAPDTVLGRLLESTSTSSSASADKKQQQPRIVQMLDSWENNNDDEAVSVAEKRTLYSTICSVTSGSRKQRFLLLLVETYSDDHTTTIDDSGIAAAKEAAIGAIRDPVTLFHEQRSMLSRPAIQALQKDHGDLFNLLMVFQEGKLQDYENYFAGKQETSVLKQWGLDAATCQRYMRILSLCSLASEHEEVPYSVIAETLKLPAVTDVETWVIAAVNSGLLQAKMDQLAQKVMVERCVVRKFDMEQWKNLQKRLSTWKDNVGSILAALKQSQASTATTTLH